MVGVKVGSGVWLGIGDCAPNVGGGRIRLGVAATVGPAAIFCCWGGACSNTVQMRGGMRAMNRIYFISTKLTDRCKTA